MNKVILSTLAALSATICSAATTYNLANGNVTVPANTTATITQSNNGTATGNTITINEGATVTLQGINIQSKWAVPISCVGSSTIIIADGSSNTVTSTSAYYAAIYAGNPGSTLTIKGGTAGTGILVADSTSQGSGAGIGASYSNSPRECGNIVIEGGVIRAMSQDGAGIGGSSDAKSGDITIKGGNVLATSISDNSGIGGGAGNITISGGTVVASGGRLCAGIGSGRSGEGDSSKVGNITIRGGTVRATGGGGAAGIGTGKGHVCGAISITGGDVVATAVTDQYFSGQAGIGAGDAGKVNGNITIGNGIIKVVATVVKSSAAHINLGTGSTGSISLNSKLKQTKSNNNLTLTLTPTYTITWKNENGTTLETDARVDRGTMPTYNGATPTKASTAQYSYTFKGWSPTVVAATADKTYTATYNSTVRSYNITWEDDDGTTLRVDSVPYGEMPSYGDNPTKAMTTQYTYEFSGWNTTVIPVAGAATYTATYSTTLRSYTVTWRDWDSSIIDYDVFFYGDTPEYQGEALVRDGYEFTGWFTSTTGGEPLDESFAISGKTSFFARWKQIRFLEGDVACIDGSVTLTSAQIAWLNGLGDYETIKASVAAMDSKAFEDAYLLNLDVTDAGRGYSFDVTGCDATGENVVVSVRLVRTGTVRKSGVDAPINGVLMLCGATAPAKDGFAPLSEIVMDNAKFSNGDEATLTFSKDATTRFFKPAVAMP